jgi:hypothetical protein
LPHDGTPRDATRTGVDGRRVPTLDKAQSQEGLITYSPNGSMNISCTSDEYGSLMFCAVVDAAAAAAAVVGSFIQALLVSDFH